MADTKIVQVNLSALTRVHYTEALEVPADMTEAELQNLLNERFHELDWEHYKFAYPDVWKRSDCSIGPASGSVEVTGRVTRPSEELGLAPRPAATLPDDDVITPWRERIKKAKAALGDTEIVFVPSQSIYHHSGDEFEAHRGQRATILHVGYDHDLEEHEFDEESLPYYCVRFEDGEELIVYEEELFSHDGRFFDLISAVSSGFALSRQYNFAGPRDLQENGLPDQRRAYLSALDGFRVQHCLQEPWTPAEYKVPCPHVPSTNVMARSEGALSFWLNRVNGACARLGDPKLVFAASEAMAADPGRKGRDGQEVQLLHMGFLANVERHWSEDTLPYFRVQFPDGETCEVVEEELFSHDPRYLDLLTAVMGGFVVARQIGYDGPCDLEEHGTYAEKEMFCEHLAEYVVKACVQADWTPEEFRVRTTEVDSSPSP